MEELINLLNENFPEYLKGKDAYKILNDPEREIITISNDESKIIASAIINKNYIEAVCVDHKFRHQGIGTSLLEECEKRILNKGYTSFLIGSNKEKGPIGIPHRGISDEEENIKFFEKRGYADENITYDVGFDSKDIILSDFELSKEVFQNIITECYNFSELQKGELEKLKKYIEEGISVPISSLEMKDSYKFYISKEKQTEKITGIASTYDENDKTIIEDLEVYDYSKNVIIQKLLLDCIARYSNKKTILYPSVDTAYLFFHMQKGKIINKYWSAQKEGRSKK